MCVVGLERNFLVPSAFLRMMGERDRVVYGFLVWFLLVFFMCIGGMDVVGCWSMGG